MKPIIGITAALDDCYDRAILSITYLEAVEKAGGLPVMLFGENGKTGISESLDGLILSGGGDIVPYYYGQVPETSFEGIQPRRDVYELGLLCECIGRVPVLGICRGMHVINVAFGGTLHQDMFGHMLRFEERHRVNIERQSRIMRWSDSDTLWTNSRHHQCVAKVGEGLIATAWTDDGYIECIEDEENDITGVQWHPEKLDDKYSRQLFNQFVSRCGLRKSQISYAPISSFSCCNG